MRLNLPFSNCDKKSDEKRFHKNLFMQDCVANDLSNALTLSSSEDEYDDNGNDLTDAFQSFQNDEPKKRGEENSEEEDNEYMVEEPQFDTYFKSNQNSEFFKLTCLSVPLIGNFLLMI